MNDKMNDKMNYEDCLRYIDSLGKYSKENSRPGLEKIKYLCGLFDNPQEDYANIHIAGTNGKGSATAMLASIMTELNYKTGRFISPYIYEFTERISINNTDISKDDIILYTGKIIRAAEQGKIPDDYMPNSFQFITLMAFLYYREKKCEIAVLETGLGGLLDPTNVIKSPLVSVIMQIGLDHMAVLGDTIEQIARAKCGIIKENSAVVLYPLNQPPVIKIAEETAREKNSAFIMPDIKYLRVIEESIDGTRFEYKGRNYTVKLAGKHQVYNALSVIEAADYLCGSGKIRGGHDAVRAGIEKTCFPSRLEIISREPLLIFDGAHNLQAVCTLRDTIKNLLPDKKIILICGMLNDKEPENIIKNIAGESFVERFVAVPVNVPGRASSPEELRAIAARCGARAEAGSLEEALGRALNDAERHNSAVVCFGSLYLAGEVRRVYDKLRDERL